MRPPKLFTAMLASFSLFAVPPAFANEPATTQQVEIEVDLTVSAAENYDRVREQAWIVCKTKLGSTYASARNRLRRDCQKQVVADAMEQLRQFEAIRLVESGDRAVQ